MEGVSGLRVFEDIGIKIHKMKHVHLHAKLLFADDARAIIGSINLAPGSFDSRRGSQSRWKMSMLSIGSTKHCTMTGRLLCWSFPTTRC